MAAIRHDTQYTELVPYIIYPYIISLAVSNEIWKNTSLELSNPVVSLKTMTINDIILELPYTCTASIITHPWLFLLQISKNSINSKVPKI